MQQRQAISAVLAVAGALALGTVGPFAHAQEITPALGHAAPSPAPSHAKTTSTTPAAQESAPPAAVDAMIERGAYLVRLGGCNDCHTPLKSGPNGSEPDVDRMLSGHPAALVMPPPPSLPAGPWTSLASSTSTAFAGPWGVSYASNLTPDQATGIGGWSERTFVQAMREGKHRGDGRPLLPPMPWQNVARLTDDDLRSVHRYLTSIPAVVNEVPESKPAPPTAASASAPPSSGSPAAR
jgi:mono/diheme cytochrome c family protein